MTIENLKSLVFEYTRDGKLVVSRYNFGGGVVTSNSTNATISFPADGFESSARFKHIVLHGGRVWINDEEFGKFHYAHYSQTCDEICFSIIKE